MKCIKIVSNGDLEGDGQILPMHVYHGILEAELRKLYPGADISITGEANTYGGDSAELYDDETGHYEDLRDVVNQIFESDTVDENRHWTPITE